MKSGLLKALLLMLKSPLILADVPTPLMFEPSIPTLLLDVQ
ncbi:hypothetical protein ALC56_01385 [Trachymyrmex septentrionalis]|uniref:Uncharacterized protein n=1 Tax=Trachymyrmex septentrionalis TaxID=34720 RepID=A0A151K0T5_9HYME|nr:hypothetical protein ALC56_01385 [Trachymyrmex septentrionalis]